MSFVDMRQFPTTIALAQSYFSIRARHTAVFSVATCIGAWLLPFIVAVNLQGGSSESTTASSTQAAAVDGILSMIWVVLAGCLINVVALWLFVYGGSQVRRETDAVAEVTTSQPTSTARSIASSEPS